MSDEVCRYGGKKLANGNCEHPGEDGLPVQSVGSWARKKHDRLRLYLDATREVRRRFVPEGPKKAGAAFIDLFAGPGRVRVRDCATTDLGSCAIAMEHSRVPFSRLIFCDADADNARALSERTREDARVSVIHGDCNERIGDIMELVPMNGLNLAFFDPFGAKTFHWKTLEALAKARRMDLLMHFPTSTVKRNYGNKSNPRFEYVIDRMIGSADWRERVPGARDAAKLITELRERLSTLGYVRDEVRSVPVHSKGKLLYHLVFAAKSTTGTDIWNSIVRHDGAQRGFDL